MSKPMAELITLLVRTASLSLFLFSASFAVFYGARLALRDVEPFSITAGDSVVIKDSTFTASAEQPGLVVGGTDE